MSDEIDVGEEVMYGWSVRTPTRRISNLTEEEARYDADALNRIAGGPAEVVPPKQRSVEFTEPDAWVPVTSHGMPMWGHTSRKPDMGGDVFRFFRPVVFAGPVATAKELGSRRVSTRNGSSS